MSIDDYDFQDPMNDALADNLVEIIATMSEEQRDLFVKTFIKKWPLLASKISFNIDCTLQEVTSVN